MFKVTITNQTIYLCFISQETKGKNQKIERKELGGISEGREKLIKADEHRNTREKELKKELQAHIQTGHDSKKKKGKRKENRD